MEIKGKQFLNLQEAVAWLLQNNALPFQSTANYAPNTEIAKTTIINPSPAEIKVGALVLFADSKVGTISGITTNGFMVGSDYTDIKNALAYIVSVAINASNHLITTLSDGTTKDAGLIKEVSSMSINGSQHLIVNYNDGTTNDLGAIFSGNITISGDLQVTGNTTVAGTITGNTVEGDTVLEKMSGYNFYRFAKSYFTINTIYAGAVKTGNKLTVALFLEITRDNASGDNLTDLCQFTIPAAVADKLIPYTISGINNSLSNFTCYAYSGIATKVELNSLIQKGTNALVFNFYGTGNLTVGTRYLLRIEQTFLLSDSL